MAGPPAHPNPSRPDMLQVSTVQLEYLVAVADHDTWAEAAASLGVSPSALSQGLAELERRVGLDLFARSGRRRTPTADHGPVLAYARGVLAATVDLSRWRDRRRRGQVGEVRVGLIDAAATHHCAEVLRAYRSRRPDVALRLTVAPSAALFDGLRRTEWDLIVAVAPPEPAPDLVVEDLLVDPLSVLAPPGVEPGPPGTWGPWVSFPEGSHTRRLIEAELGAAGATVAVVAESHQPEVLREMVRLGVGWTVLPLAGLGPVDDLVVARPGLAHRTLVLGRRAGGPADPGVEDLAAAIRDGVGRPGVAQGGG